MKTTINCAILAVAALTLGLTSCSKDNGGKAPAQGKEAKLNISVTAPENSRASVTDPATIPSDMVNNFTAFVVEGATLYSGYSDDGTALEDATAITATTASTAVYVIANAGDLTATVTTVDALTNYIADLNGTGSQTGADGRWATGQIALTSADFVQEGDDFIASKSINLTFIAARITVKVVNSMENYGNPGSLTLESVAILNARGQSRLFPTSGQTSLIPSSYTSGNAKNFYQGLANDSFASYPAAGDFTMATALLSDEITTPATQTFYYYVFENDADTPEEFPTIVTIIGDDNGDPVYWPVHITSYESWGAGSGSVASITRANSYNLTITLSGDAAGNGGGTTDPTTPIVNALVNVSVTLTPWNPVTLNKEFD